MKQPPPTEDNAFYLELTEPFLQRGDVVRSTMMGFPCMRVNGQFFASCDPKSGDLLVKLPADKVAEMVSTGEGSSFSPAGRTFKEWVVIPGRLADRCNELLNDALAFVSGA